MNLLWLRFNFALILLFVTCFIGYQFITRYFMDYNEAGRYFDQEKFVVYHEQGVGFFGLLFFMSFTLLVWAARSVY